MHLLSHSIPTHKTKCFFAVGLRPIFHIFNETTSFIGMSICTHCTFALKKTSGESTRKTPPISAHCYNSTPTPGIINLQ